MAGNTINTVPRRVVLNPGASILNTLLVIQREQIEVSKYEHIDLAELQSHGLSAAGLFKTLLNFVNLPGDQKQPSKWFDLSADDVLWVRRDGSYDG